MIWAFGRECIRELLPTILFYKSALTVKFLDDYLPVPIKGFSGIEVGRMAHVRAIDRSAELRVPEIAGHAMSEKENSTRATLCRFQS